MDLWCEICGSAITKYGLCSNPEAHRPPEPDRIYRVSNWYVKAHSPSMDVRVYSVRNVNTCIEIRARHLEAAMNMVNCLSANEA